MAIETMRSKTRIIKDLKALQRWQAILDRDKAKLCAEYAKNFCPHKVGEVAECKGYLYKEKKVKITTVFSAINSLNQIGWGVGGGILESDGGDSRDFVYWNEWDDEHFDTH